MKIIIGADVVPNRFLEHYFINGNISELLGDQLVEIWQHSDFRLINLETPITNGSKPISKNGPNLKADPKTLFRDFRLRT